VEYIYHVAIYASSSRNSSYEMHSSADNPFQAS